MKLYVLVRTLRGSDKAWKKADKSHVAYPSGRLEHTVECLPVYIVVAFVVRDEEGEGFIRGFDLPNLICLVDEVPAQCVCCQSCGTDYLSRDALP